MKICLFLSEILSIIGYIWSYICSQTILYSMHVIIMPSMFLFPSVCVQSALLQSASMGSLEKVFSGSTKFG